MADHPLSFRIGVSSDAERIAALAVQVFLDTYATDGVRPDLANEAFAEYSAARFATRVAEVGRVFVLAERRSGLLGFAEVLRESAPSPVAGYAGSELVRLYVQPQAQRHGLGRVLMAHSEQVALQAGASGLWLAAWEGNTKALGFYVRMGYADVGRAMYVIQGQSFGNRIMFKRTQPRADEA